MFSATDFTYDGIYSRKYGLQIASIEGDVMNETTYATPTIVTTKPPKAKRFYYLDGEYDEPPTYEFAVFSESAIPDLVQRDILAWLDNRKGFKPLVIHQPELYEYTYNCVFTVTSIIYHAGCCVGFKLRATFDSPYQYKRDKGIVVQGTGEMQEIYLYNGSDLAGEYIYPSITFTPTAYMDGNCSISIFNRTDDPDLTREFKFVDTPLNTKICVDNDIKMIKCESGGDFLSKFEGMNWLRLVSGRNYLQVKINGEAKIEFPQYIKIRF